MTERRFLRDQAERCRRLAKASSDEDIAVALRTMAAEYDRLAESDEESPDPTS